MHDVSDQVKGRQREKLRRRVTGAAAAEAIEKGIMRGEFIPWYQTVHDAGGRVTGVETLLRWEHPEQGILGPGEFIATAEAFGLIHSLGMGVLASVALHCREGLLEKIGPEGRIALNLSPDQIAEPSFLPRLADFVADRPLPRDRCDLEITETSVLEDANGSVARLHLLREFGFRIILDDFGTGYAFLSQLQALPLDGIKIDQRFTRRLPHCEKSAEIIRAIIQLAEQMGLTVTAEGVETASQWQALVAMGCRSLQGFFFSRPAPLDGLQDYSDADADADGFEGKARNGCGKAGADSGGSVHH